MFRKWKLRPSNRFDEKMKPIDFSPSGRMDDDLYVAPLIFCKQQDSLPRSLEKTLHRSASNASADRQRQALVAELDGSHNPNHVPGIPEHDFTAGGAGVGAAGGAGAYGAYQADPFAPAHAQYDDYYQHQDATHGYPPQQQYDQYGRPYEYPTQDGEYAAAAGVGAGAGAGVGAGVQGQDGYADLKRGNSNGSDGQHQYAHANANGYAGHGQDAHYGHHQQPYNHNQSYQPQHQQPSSADQYDFPESGNYLGRPTGGSDGP